MFAAATKLGADEMFWDVTALRALGVAAVGEQHH
jgi:hypothetical protein